jgi:ribosomal protein L35
VSSKEGLGTRLTCPFRKKEKKIKRKTYFKRYFMIKKTRSQIALWKDTKLMNDTNTFGFN